MTKRRSSPFYGGHSRQLEGGQPHTDRQKPRAETEGQGRSRPVLTRAWKESPLEQVCPVRWEAALSRLQH